MDIDIVNQNLNAAKLSKARPKTGSPAEKAGKEKELKKACEGFESIIVNTMIKSMRGSLPGDALFGESNSKSIYKSMYDQYLSEDIARKNPSTGLKDFLFQQLKKAL